MNSTASGESHARISELGRSVEGRLIEAATFGGPGPASLILGGMHGDEPKGVYVANLLTAVLQEQPELCAEHPTIIVPCVNPDGYERRRRRNSNWVDLNRNYPTDNWAASPRQARYHGGVAPGSEPETRALIELIEREPPARIITIHSISKNKFCNNHDGPAGLELATAMSRINNYPVVGSIGYPTPGSFGAWAGMERSIPMVTLELPSHHSRERCWRDNRDALLLVINTPTR